MSLRLLLLLSLVLGVCHHVNASNDGSSDVNQNSDVASVSTESHSDAVRNEEVKVSISNGVLAFGGTRSVYHPVTFSIRPGETLWVPVEARSALNLKESYMVTLSPDGSRLVLDADTRSPIIIDDDGWMIGKRYTPGEQDRANSRMQSKGIYIDVKSNASSVSGVPSVVDEGVVEDAPLYQYYDDVLRYGDVVTITISGGMVAFHGKRKEYQPVAFDLRRGERKQIEFVSTDKYPRKDSYWMALSDDGNTVYLDEGQRKEIVLINRNWERGQVYHPEERDDHGSQMECLGIEVSVVYKKIGGRSHHWGDDYGPYDRPVTVIVSGGEVAFLGKRKEYHPVAFDIYPGESKEVEFVSTDKYPRKMKYLMTLSEDGNTLKLDADQRKAIVLVDRHWDRGETYHPEERDDHGSRMEAFGIEVTVRRKGKRPRP